MNYKQKSALAAAVAATLGGVGVADAAITSITLYGVTSFSPNGSSAGNLASSTATWDYDDTALTLTQTGGTFNVRFNTAPFTTIFRHTITGLVVGSGSPTAVASTFACIEGGFGGTVGASICGNYNFGANFVNQSSTSWGPGTAAARTAGGDDMLFGPMQSITAYNYFATVSFDGTHLSMGNAACNTFAGACPGGTGPNTGYSWTLSTVPVPAAVWLFGSGLGLLGALRRRAKA